MAKLFIGPWVGEFGVELMRWQGRARFLAAESTWDEVVVATRKEHFFLYEDFASRCVAFEPGTIHTGGRDCLGHNFKGLGADFDPGPDDLHLTPFMSDQQWQEHELLAQKKSKFINYSKESRFPNVVATCEILIHARASEKLNQQFKNWPLNAWNEFVKNFSSEFRIGSIGSLTGAHHIQQTVDLRGIPLEELSAHMGKAQLLVGPSSGPMHLAMLCETPLVTWCDATGSHLSHWNPFQVPICLLPGWAPRPAVVCAKVRQMLSMCSTKTYRFIVSCPSGTDYHAFVAWLVRKYPSVNYLVMHDCITDIFQSHPKFRFVTPIKKLTPKYFNEPSLAIQVEGNMKKGTDTELLPVVFDLPMGRWAEILSHHPGAQGIVLLEDLGTTLIRLKSEWRGFYDVPIPEDIFKQLSDLYSNLLDLAVKKKDPYINGILFISLNRLRQEENYRNEIARLMHCDHKDDEVVGSSGDVAREIGAKLVGGRLRKFVSLRKLGQLEKQFHHFEPRAGTVTEKIESS